jgi:hypothetical protein
MADHTDSETPEEDYEVKHCVVTGGMPTGFEIIGPFDSEELADAYAESNLEDYPIYWVMPLTNPNH